MLDKLQWVMKLFESCKSLYWTETFECTDCGKGFRTNSDFFFNVREFIVENNPMLIIHMERLSDPAQTLLNMREFTVESNLMQ